MPDIVSEGFPRWHSLVCMCVSSFSRHSVLTVGVTLQLIPRGRHDSYSCQIVTKDNALVLDLWPLTFICIYTHSHTSGSLVLMFTLQPTAEWRSIPLKKKKHGLNLDLFCQAVSVHGCMWWKIWVLRLQKPSEQIWISKLWSAHLICLGRG